MPFSDYRRKPEVAGYDEPTPSPTHRYTIDEVLGRTFFKKDKEKKK